MFLVVGAGVSGLGAVELLNNLKEDFILYDKNKKKLKSIYQSKLIPQGTKTCYKISKKLMTQIKTLVLSPGVELSRQMCKFIKKYGIRVIGELELGAKHSNSIIIAITGTNGKTTTTELANHILNHKEKQSLAVGNNGTSICSVNNVKPNYLVCEVSSFQLENAKTFHPHIAMFLNFAPDHLNRYKALNNYFNAKLHIFDNQTKNDWAIINYDEEKLRTLKLKAKTIWVSAKQSLKTKAYAVWCENSNIIIKIKNNIHKINLINTPLFCGGNAYNIMFASVAGLLCGVDAKTIKKQIKSFSLPNHRCEFVAEINGVRFINDSKATNIHATQNALNSFSGNIVLLLGGSDKGEDFKPFFQKMPQNVKKIITFGSVGAKLCRLASKQKLYVRNIKNFDKAVNFAKQTAGKGDIVLLSPACASFDAFSNYQQRGDYFKYLITGEKFE